MKQEYDFVVTLKYNKFERIDLISELMLLISVCAFLYIAFYVYPSSQFYYYLLTVFVVVSAWAYAKFFRKKDEIALYGYSLFIVALGWWLLPGGNIIIGCFFLIAALIEKQVKFPKEIGFNKDGVVFNNFPKKHFAWNKISNVVLKDGMLTIDYKNNKLLQKEVEEDVLPKIEKDFNEFCRLHISN
jgi:hypothetical protein